MLVGPVTSVEVAPVASGNEKYRLTLKGEHQLMMVDVSEEALPRARQLAAGIQDVKQSRRYRAGGTVA